MIHHTPASKGVEIPPRKVLIVDDHAVVRDCMGVLIDAQPDMMVCGFADGVGSAMSVIEKKKPEIVLIDISLSDGNGLGLIKNVKARWGDDIRMLVVTMHEESVLARRALRAGADGYIMKVEACDKVIQAMRQIFNGGIYVSEKLAAEIVAQQFKGAPDPRSNPLEALSFREVEILQMLGNWKGTRQIAGELHLSIKTIEYYRDQIKKKLNLKTGPDLIQFATRWVEEQTKNYEV